MPRGTTRNLSNISNEATEVVNAPDVLTPILEIQPDDRMFLRILNAVAAGNQVGVPIYADLKSQAGGDMPLNTTLTLQFLRNGATSPETIADTLDNIRPWRSLSISEQESEEYIDSVKVNLRGESVTAGDADKILVSVNSAEKIDWGSSQLYIENDAVREFSRS